MRERLREGKTWAHGPVKKSNLIRRYYTLQVFTALLGLMRPVYDPLLPEIELLYNSYSHNTHNEINKMNETLLVKIGHLVRDVMCKVEHHYRELALFRRSEDVAEGHQKEAGEVERRAARLRPCAPRQPRAGWSETERMDVLARRVVDVLTRFRKFECVLESARRLLDERTMTAATTAKHDDATNVSRSEASSSTTSSRGITSRSHASVR